MTTNKIYDCKEGTRTYYHEIGHLKFNSKTFGVKINYYASFFQMIAIFFIGLGILTNNIFVKAFGFVNVSGMIACYFIEEIWCWIYSFKNYCRKE